MSSKSVSDFRRRRKENLVKVCGGKCNICGYSRSIAALEFHHIDENTKKYSISQDGVCHSLETDLQEINKCILLCANCHREVHNGFYNNDFLLSKKIYNEEIANQLIEERDNPSVKEILHCKICNAELSPNNISGICIKCLIESSKKKRPDRETLKKEIRNFTFLSLGEKYGVSDNAIRKWCDSYNLPRKKSDIVKYTDKDWEEI